MKKRTTKIIQYTSCPKKLKRVEFKLREGQIACFQSNSIREMRVKLNYRMSFAFGPL